MTLLRTAFAGPTGEQVWLPTYAFLIVGTLLVVLAVWAAPRAAWPARALTATFRSTARTSR